jgi:hypothetical protein
MQEDFCLSIGRRIKFEVFGAMKYRFNTAALLIVHLVTSFLGFELGMRAGKPHHLASRDPQICPTTTHLAGLC